MEAIAWSILAIIIVVFLTTLTSLRSDVAALKREVNIEPDDDVSKSYLKSRYLLLDADMRDLEARFQRLIQALEANGIVLPKQTIAGTIPWPLPDGTIIGGTISPIED